MLEKLVNFVSIHRLLLLLTGFFGILLFISIIYPLLPLTDDEAWNYLAYSRFGQLYPITHYELPNNHVFFTFLETFILHKRILAAVPLEMRFLNIIICTIFAAFICYIFTKFFSKKVSIWFLAFLAAVIFFASPLSTPYFIVARGYILGTLLILVGTYLLNRNKYYSASVFFILSAWTIPTFILAVPLQYLVVWYYAKKDIKKILISGLMIPIGSLILYFPILNQLREAANAGWGIASFHEFSVKTFFSISNLSYLSLGWLLNFIYLLIAIFSVYILLKKGSKNLKKFTVQLFLACIGYIIFTIAIFMSGHSGLPFIRNGVFIPLFLTILIAAAALISSDRTKIFLYASLGFNILAGVYLFTKLLPFNKHEYPVFAGEQKYTSDSLKYFLNNKDKRYIVDDKKDSIIIMYYAFIYDIPIRNSVK